MSALPARADVAVVGGGVMGTSIAFHLARRGADVVLLERGAVCSGPTRHSTAIIRLHYSQPLLVRLAAYGLRAYLAFADEVGADAGFRRTGMVFAVPEAEGELLAANVELGRREGANTRVLAAEEARELEPRLDMTGLSSCFEPDAGYCDPYAVAAGYAAAAERRGAAITPGIVVERVREDGVDTRAGRVEAGAVVVAAGPWSPALLAPLGYALPVTAAPAEVGRYRLPASFGPPPPAVAIFAGEQFYLRPAEPGFVEVGSLAPEHTQSPVDPDRPVEGARDETLARYARALSARLPTAAGGHWRGAWTGIYDVTPDWEPVLGTVPGRDRVVAAAGFSGHGFKLAPAVGVAVAELVLDGAATTFDVDPLAPDRFERGALIGARYGYSVLG
ncbi:MAG: FAD-binding oxidoreductase [Thermoleophilia bacterium]|nr:FAD-binding oxidoreductase [Thermoleophilia bacterium]